MSKCDIKTVAEAWNAGIDSFESAFLLSDSPTKAIRFALSEIKEKYPDIDFSTESFTNPLIETLKANKIVSESYKFKGDAKSQVEKIVSKFEGLDEKQSKEMSGKIFEKFFQKGDISEQDVKNAFAQMKGYPSITPEFNKLIDQVAADRQAYESIENEIKGILGQIQTLKKNKEYSKEKDSEFSDRLTQLKKEQNVALENYLKSDLAFGEHLSKGRHWVYQFGDIMKMNLMTPVSLLKNTSGMIGDTLFRNFSNLISAPVSSTVLLVRRALKKTDATFSSIPLLSKTEGAFKGSANAKAKLYAKYGTDPVYNDQIRTPNYIDGMRNVRKILEGDKTPLNTLAAVFKLSPSIITRGLGSPDFFFQEMSEVSELNRIGKEKGYDGAELKAFLLAPDPESLKLARDYAKKVTYKQDMPLEEFFRSKLDFAQIGDKMIENGGNPFLVRLGTGVGHVIKNLIMPFTKTPINLLRSANKIVLPEYTLIKGLYEASKITNGDQKTNKIITSISDATVGFHLRMIALNMVAQGLISAGYDDEEQKTKEIVEKKAGGSNRVNINALWRGLTFQEIKERPGDTYTDINALGTVGIALGAYAHAYNKYGKDDLQNEIDYLKNGNYLKIPAKAALSELSSSLDFTFFSGFNEAARAIRDESGYALDKYIQNSMMTMMGGILPGTHQLLSKAETPERIKTYDKDLTFGQNVYNQFGYRFLFGKGIDPSLNYNALTEKGESAVKVKDHYLFDDYWGRLLASADPFKSKIINNPNTPTYKIYQAMRTVEKKEREKFMPPMVNDEINVGTRKKPVYANLNKEQYTYLQQQASMHRMLLVTPFVMSQDFETMDFETKTDVLQGLYKKGREQAINELKLRYPDLRKTGTKGQKASKKDAEKLIKKYS
jgi:hypothetical protein